jgi:hypothetical protein
MVARSPSRSFRHKRISSRCFARSSSSFWFDPRGRSHLKMEQFRNAPEMIGQSCCHGRAAGIPVMLAVTQLLMRPTEIVGTSNQIHARLKSRQTPCGMPTFARQRRQTFPHGGTLAFNQRGIELLASSCHGEQVLRFLKSAPGELARHLHHPFVLGMLDNGSNTQVWPHFQTASSSPSRPFHFFAKGSQHAFWVG